MSRYMSAVDFETRIFVAMTRPSVLVNTYVKSNELLIDFVSKIFIIGGLFFGINRLPLLGNINIVFLIFSFLTTFLFMCHYSFFFYSVFDITHMGLIIGIHYVQWAFVLIFNLVAIKRLKRYYNELNVFDKEVGCGPRIGKASIINLIQTLVLLLFMMSTYALPEITDALQSLYLSAMPFTLCIIQEVHYYGHLLSLLIPRMRLINYYMELPLTHSKIMKTLNLEDFGYSKADTKKTLCEIENMMNLYHNMIKAHNFLMEAVKWQFLVTLMSTFLIILMGTYNVSLSVIHDGVSVTAMEITWFYALSFILLSACLTLSLFSPCVLADQVHYEVARLRELLAARIYENQMDRCSRVIARALLAWTETRDLSFSLLRMLDIDISLPFKFVGLLVTYVIILLQFQKIIDPDA